MPPQVQIHRITAVVPHASGNAIVVKADALMEDQRTELEIAVTADLAPTMALALLATTAEARALRDELGPALDVLGAAVVRSSSKDKVRLQLIFGEGVVLPLELTTAAGEALSNGLVEYLSSSKKRLAVRRGLSDAQPGA